MTPEETTVPRRAAIIPAALLFAAASLPADAPPDGKPADDAPPKNLVANGDFEDGDDTPKGWQTVDGLSSFYATDADPKHGKVLKIGQSKQWGRYLELQDANGNIYTYANLGSIPKLYPVPKPVPMSAASVVKAPMRKPPRSSLMVLRPGMVLRLTT